MDGDAFLEDIDSPSSENTQDQISQEPDKKSPEPDERRGMDGDAFLEDIDSPPSENTQDQISQEPDKRSPEPNKRRGMDGDAFFEDIESPPSENTQDQISQEPDKKSPEPNKDEDALLSDGPFGDDLEDEEEQEQDNTGNAFSNMVDEIDEDEEEEEEEREEHEGEVEKERAHDRKPAEDKQAASSDSEVEDGDKKADDNSLSDFDLMMQRRKEAMARARKRRRVDIDLSSVDDHIHAMLQEMKYSAEEDCRLNLKKKPAVKKLSMLPTVISQLKKIDLLTTFIESGMCSALADWLKPLPDHTLPHLKIREEILDILATFPEMDGHVLKTSGLGKAIMLLYRHPKETKKNKEKAGKLISNWSRPIFGLTSDYKALSRDEREERDWARLSQTAKRRLSSTGGGESSQGNVDESSEGQKPGDKGWIPRARVPMPSHKDYVVRPKWNVDREIKKSGSSKRSLNRYEKHMQKKREKQSRNKNTHAISISIEGRKMPL